MKFAYKTELKPTEIQAQKIKENIGTCRWLYNQYISLNYQLYQLFQRGFLDEKQPHFLTAKDFDKYINNKIKVKSEYSWINNCSSKARKKAITNAEQAFKRHFIHKAKLPKFKRRDAQDMALYFPKNNPTDWAVERHRIKIPTFGWVRLKEYGYLPTDERVINGNVSCKAGRYYISITVDKKIKKEYIPVSTIFNAVGIILDFCDEESDVDVRIRRAMKILHRKRTGYGANSANQEKMKQKIQRLRQQRECQIRDENNKTIAKIISNHPQQVFLPVLKDLDKEKIRRFYTFRNALLLKANRLGIELNYIDNLPNKNMEMIKVKIN